MQKVWRETEVKLKKCDCSGFLDLPLNQYFEKGRQKESHLDFIIQNSFIL